MGFWKPFPTCPTFHSPVQSTLFYSPARQIFNLFRLRQVAQVFVPAIPLAPVLKGLWSYYPPATGHIWYNLKVLACAVSIEQMTRYHFLPFTWSHPSEPPTQSHFSKTVQIVSAWPRPCWIPSCLQIFLHLHLQKKWTMYTLPDFELPWGSVHHMFNFQRILSYSMMSAGSESVFCQNLGAAYLIHLIYRQHLSYKLVNPLLIVKWMIPIRTTFCQKKIYFILQFK